MENELEKRGRKAAVRLSNFVLTVIGALMGLGIALTFIVCFDPTTLPDALLAIALIIVLLYLASTLQTIFHEAGHLVCGLLTGYTFSSFRIGPLMLIKTDGKIRFRRYSMAGTRGQCLLIPPEHYDDNLPVLLYNLGGSIANLIVSAIAIGLFFLAQSLPVLSAFLLLLATVGIAYALMNGIPLQMKMINNDGYNAFSLRKNAVTRHCFWSQMRINALMTNGVRLKDMPEEWFAVPDPTDMKNSLCAAAGFLAFSRAVDKLDFKTAEEIRHYLLENAEGLTGLHRNVLTSETIFCELIGENRVEEIDRLYSKDFQKFVVLSAKTPSVIRMRYAYDLLSKKDETEANKKLAAFEKVAKTYPYPCEIEGERELIAVAKKVYDTNLQ